MKISEINKKIIGIYKINFPNKKSYIGLSNDIKRRIGEHFYKNSHLPCHKAIRKYFSSIEEIDFDILEEIEEEDYILLSQREKYWINYFDTCNKEKGYNLTKGGIALLTTENPFAKFNEDEINQIYALLQSGHTNVEIGKVFNCHPDTIGHVNTGKTYYNPDFDYPLRKETIHKKDFEAVNSITEKQYNQIVEYLLNTNIPISTVAKLTQVNISTCHRINQGKIHQNNFFSYPLRKSTKHKVTSEEVKEIIELLKLGEFSITYIATLYRCSRDTISDINNGKRHQIEGEIYPIRTKYPSKRLSKLTKQPVSTILESEEQGSY